MRSIQAVTSAPISVSSSASLPTERLCVPWLHRHFGFVIVLISLSVWSWLYSRRCQKVGIGDLQRIFSCMCMRDRILPHEAVFLRIVQHEQSTPKYHQGGRKCVDASAHKIYLCQSRKKAASSLAQLQLPKSKYGCRRRFSQGLKSYAVRCRVKTHGGRWCRGCQASHAAIDTSATCVELLLQIIACRCQSRGNPFASCDFLFFTINSPLASTLYCIPDPYPVSQISHPPPADGYRTHPTCAAPQPPSIFSQATRWQTGTSRT